METQQKPPTDTPKTPKKNKLTSITLLAGTGLIITGLLTIGILPRLQRKTELDALAKTAATDVPTLNVTKPKPGKNSTELNFPGSIQASQETTIYARSSGYLRQRTVDIGDKVRQGQTLAFIDAPETDQDVQQGHAELAKAEANLAQVRADLVQKQSNLSQAKSNLQATQAQLVEAKTNMQLARQNWQRWQQLVQQGAVSAQSADEHKTQYDASVANVNTITARVKADQDSINTAVAGIASQQANVNAYLASLAASRANMQRLTVLQNFKQVTAPFAGTITARNVDTGALISAGSNSNSSNAWLFKLAQTDSLRIKVSVPQSFIQSIRQGETAQVHVRELPAKTFTGKIVRTADSLDASTNTLLTEILVPNPGNILRPGMYAQVMFTANRTNAPLLVPANTLVTNAKGTQVIAVAPDNTVHYHKVELGRDYGTEVEVTSGITPDMALVTNPTDDLQEGARVKISKRS